AFGALEVVVARAEPYARALDERRIERLLVVATIVDGEHGLSEEHALGQDVASGRGCDGRAAAELVAEAALLEALLAVGPDGAVGLDRQAGARERVHHRAP